MKGGNKEKGKRREDEGREGREKGRKGKREGKKGRRRSLASGSQNHNLPLQPNFFSDFTLYVNNFQFQIYSNSYLRKNCI